MSVWNLWEEIPLPTISLNEDIGCGTPGDTLIVSGVGHRTDDGKCWRIRNGESHPTDPYGFSEQISQESRWATVHVATVNPAHYYHSAWAVAAGVCSATITDTLTAPEEVATSTLSDEIAPVWTLRHHPTATCYLAVWFDQKFIDDVTSGETVTPITDPYIWTPSESPLCLIDPTKPPDHADNMVISDPITFTPTPYGTNSLIIRKWSCLPDYTPPDDGSANGFPVS
jgi:hypothetical protein